VLSGEAAFVLAVLATDLALFFHGRVRPDLVALLSLSALAVGGVVTPSEAFGGFANPAVITVASVFVLSGALARTGVAALVVLLAPTALTAAEAVGAPHPTPS